MSLPSVPPPPKIPKNSLNSNDGSSTSSVRTSSTVVSVQGPPQQAPKLPSSLPPPQRPKSSFVSTSVSSTSTTPSMPQYLKPTSALPQRPASMAPPPVRPMSGVMPMYPPAPVPSSTLPSSQIINSEKNQKTSSVVETVTTTTTVDKKSKSSKKDKKKSKKEKEKEAADALESSFMDFEFDKSLFQYNRLKNFSGPNQIEDKAKVKTGSWSERYLVMFCDYIICFDTKFGFIPPRDFEKPIGAIFLLNTEYKEIKEFEDKMDLEGLVPKLISYDHCIELPVHVSANKVNNFLIQFENQETADKWLESLRARSKAFAAIKNKVEFASMRFLLEELLRDYPINNKLKDPPQPGEEHLWLDKLISYWNIRSKHKKDLRRAQYFSSLNTIQYRNYIEWFVTPGGESGKSSLEREITTAEDSVIVAWYNAVSSQYIPISRQIDFIDVNNQQVIGQLLGVATVYTRYLDVYIKFYSSVYPNKNISEAHEYNNKWNALVMKLTNLLEQSERSSEVLNDAQQDDPFFGIQVVKF